MTMTFPSLLGRVSIFNANSLTSISDAVYMEVYSRDGGRTWAESTKFLINVRNIPTQLFQGLYLYDFFYNSTRRKFSYQSRLFSVTQICLGVYDPNSTHRHRADATLFPFNVFNIFVFSRAK